MDKGRIMDNIQNNNARFVDNFGNGKTSVKTSNPPGGKSSFSLGWDDNNTYNNPAPKKNFSNLNQNQNQQQNSFQQSYQQPMNDNYYNNSQQSKKSINQQNQQNYNYNNYANEQQSQVISNTNAPKTSVRVKKNFLFYF